MTLKKNTLPPDIFVLLNTLKVTAKTSVEDILRLNTLSCTKIAFFKLEEHPLPLDRSLPPLPPPTAGADFFVCVVNLGERLLMRLILYIWQDSECYFHLLRVLLKRIDPDAVDSSVIQVRE